MQGMNEEERTTAALDALLDAAPAPAPASLACLTRLKEIPDRVAVTAADRWYDAVAGLRALFSPRWLLPQALTLALLFVAGMTVAQRGYEAEESAVTVLALGGGDALIDEVGK